MPRTTTSTPRPRNVRFTLARRERRREDAHREIRTNYQYRKLEKGQHLHNCANWFHLYNNFDVRRTLMHRKISLWHETKQTNPNDDIILMKVGAFIEVFNKDADVFHTEFEFPYMKGGIAWTGFPYSCLNDYITKLSEKGYTYDVVEYGWRYGILN